MNLTVVLMTDAFLKGLCLITIEGYSRQAIILHEGSICLHILYIEGFPLLVLEIKVLGR
jgi:hypothetical protein